jgi:hypothetical protein
MADDSTRTVLVALGAGVGVALAKVGAAVFTGSTALAAEAAHSLADSGNDLALFVAQRRSSRAADDQHPLGYGREASTGPTSCPLADRRPCRNRAAGPPPPHRARQQRRTAGGRVLGWVPCCRSVVSLDPLPQRHREQA